MKTVCSSSMPFVEEAFSTIGETVVRDGRAICADDVRDADVLAIRSTTPVNAELLAGSSVRFVGTATIGTDHLDIPYLDERGIGWCYSPGCNANSVSEYVVAALLELGQRHGITLDGKTLGVIGVGNVGSRVAHKAEILGMHVLRNDPPRRRDQAQGRVETDEVFHDIDDVLGAADVITMHVPLTREGPDRTVQLVDADFLSRMKPGCIFVNSARGPVVNTAALLDALERGRVAHAVIDTWEGEPAYPAALLTRADIGTPHIAGYSYDGKVNGTVMVYEAACTALGLEACWSPAELLAPPPVPTLTLDVEGKTDEAAMHAAVTQVYDIAADDRRLRESCSPDEHVRAARFDALRKGYPVRREFQFTTVSAPGAPGTLKAKLRGLGFQLT